MKRVTNKELKFTGVQVTIKKSASATRFRERMRCIDVPKCGHRFTLKKRPYAGQEFQCEMCGGRTRSVEKERRREMAKRENCECIAIGFKHQKGTVLGCDHHPKPFEDWTSDDHRQYQEMLKTPRGG